MDSEIDYTTKRLHSRVKRHWDGTYETVEVCEKCGRKGWKRVNDHPDYAAKLTALAGEKEWIHLYKVYGGLIGTCRDVCRIRKETI